MEVVWSELALETLANVYMYVEDGFGVQKAEELANGIVMFVDGLSKMPRIGAIAEDWSTYGEVRRVVYKQNVIYYHITEDRLKIIAVWDSRQNPLRLRQLISHFFMLTK